MVRRTRIRWRAISLSLLLDIKLVTARLNVQSDRSHFRRSVQDLTPAFFGENLSNDGQKLDTFPNADSARDKLFRFFRNPETETFENYPVGTRFPFISSVFASVGDAFLSGAQTALITDQEQFGRYGVSGEKFLDVDANDDFIMQFQNPIVGFGFYAIDVGDNAGVLTIETSLNGGNLKRYVVQHTIGRGSGPSGSDRAVMYAGLIDLDGFDTITFDLQQGSSPLTDFFGFDDFSVFSIDQFVGTELPTVSLVPSTAPSFQPTTSTAPSISPTTLAPSENPSRGPTQRPTSANPTLAVSASPSVAASAAPSVVDSSSPTLTVSSTPSLSVSPSSEVSASPSIAISATPSIAASAGPSIGISSSPSFATSGTPSIAVSASPSFATSGSPSIAASASPSFATSGTPSITASASPSFATSGNPSVATSGNPSIATSASPSFATSASPSIATSSSPTPIVSSSVLPTVSPSVLLVSAPTQSPSVQASTAIPSDQPTAPSGVPTRIPVATAQPTIECQSEAPSFDAPSHFDPSSGRGKGKAGRLRSEHGSESYSLDGGGESKSSHSGSESSLTDSEKSGKGSVKSADCGRQGKAAMRSSSKYSISSEREKSERHIASPSPSVVSSEGKARGMGKANSMRLPSKVNSTKGEGGVRLSLSPSPSGHGGERSSLSPSPVVMGAEGERHNLPASKVGKGKAGTARLGDKRVGGNAALNDVDDANIFLRKNRKQNVLYWI